MPPVLVVEGRTDAAFFRELFIRLFHELTAMEIRSSDGKYFIPTIVAGLIDIGVLDIVVAQDTDERAAEQTVLSVKQMVYSKLGADLPSGSITQKKFTVAGRSFAIIPMGLHEDEALRSLGIKQHSLDDYLIKLILEDAGLREKVPTLGPLLQQLLPMIRQQDGPFEKSKELFQLIKPMVRHGFSDTGVVQKVVRDADDRVLRAVLAPLLLDVELAFDL